MVDETKKSMNAGGHHTMISSDVSKDQRMVAVRYYLDRPGYDQQHSSVRLWKNPPETCTTNDVQKFLNEHGLFYPELAVEIYLDKFHAYMLLEACHVDSVVFDFSSTSIQNPGVLNIRLTDTSSGGMESQIGAGQQAAVRSNCNTGPVGLFAFSLTVALETADLLGKLVPNSVDPSFLLTWGPFAFFVSGLLQLIVGIFEVTRNNEYGATAFLAFGSFWLANGTRLILLGYRPEEIPDQLLGSDPVGHFIRNFYIFGFVCALLKQTLVMNKLTTTLIVMLCAMMLATSIAGWVVAFEWIQMVLGWMVSVFAFYVFLAEFTNEVYQRQVFNMHPWAPDSPDEFFGAAGRATTLQSKATKLRTAQVQNATDLRDVRTALPQDKNVDHGD